MLTSNCIEWAKKCGDIRVILDVGSRDMMQAMELSDAFPDAQNFAFEANPSFLPECKARTRGNMHLIPKAVMDYDGEVKFQQCSSLQNPGASSIFKPSRKILDKDLSIGMRELTVPCTTLKTWAEEAGVKKVDVIWMDIQGAEMAALRGLGDLLNTVKVIATEAATSQVYSPTLTHTPASYEEINLFLIDSGFVRVDFEQDWECEANVIYVNKTYA